jgi:hypothetical protein
MPPTAACRRTRDAPRTAPRASRGFAAQWTGSRRSWPKEWTTSVPRGRPPLIPAPVARRQALARVRHRHGLAALAVLRAQLVGHRTRGVGAAFGEGQVEGRCNLVQLVDGELSEARHADIISPGAAAGATGDRRTAWKESARGDAESSVCEWYVDHSGGPATQPGDSVLGRTVVRRRTPLDPLPSGAPDAPRGAWLDVGRYDTPSAGRSGRRRDSSDQQSGGAGHAPPARRRPLLGRLVLVRAAIKGRELSVGSRLRPAGA